MKQGSLSQYFDGVAIKRLSAVEVKPDGQHEFNGTAELVKLFGRPVHGQRNEFITTFIWFGEESGQELVAQGSLTWYQSRQLPRTEPRLYYQSTVVSELASAGDMLLVGRRTNGAVLAVIAKAGSTAEGQLRWLFGRTDKIGVAFESQLVSGSNDIPLDFVARYILEELGLELDEPESAIFDRHLERFNNRFPTTAVFSSLARKVSKVKPTDNPDDALLRLMDTEERLFRHMERRIVATRLEQGFIVDGVADVEGFIQYSLSVQNRRKARAGLALENHLDWILDISGVKYQRNVETERGKKPDFLFPSRNAYRSPTFPVVRLSMLGVKSSLNDRWRQVLDEAERIPEKHLLTLEPAISARQTNQMQSGGLRLVVPFSLHRTYKPAQREWLFSVVDFISLVRDRQVSRDT